MSRIVLFLPREEMLSQAEKISQSHRYDLDEIKYVQTTEVINETRRVLSEGASIIIARGVQANLIKSYTNIPVVEITLTGQEIGLLIVAAKKQLEKSNPKIGLVGSRNMFSDLTYFNEIFDIELKTYFGDSAETLRSAIHQATREDLDIIIGGEMACLAANDARIPYLFLQSTEDSIQSAIKVARQLRYVSEIESRNNAQVEALMEHSNSGIIKLNIDGCIIQINHIMEEIIGKSMQKIEGAYIWDVIKEIDSEQIKKVLIDGDENYSTFIRLNHQAIVITVAPIKVDTVIEGAILSCQMIKKISKLESEKLRELYLHGYVAKSTFDDIPKTSNRMQSNIELAKLFSQSNTPILIEGEIGTEKELFAESIHNNGLRRNGPFISIFCGDMTEEMQAKILFGNEDTKEIGALGTGTHGTVLINEIDKLVMRNQYRLYKAIKYKALIQNDIEKTMTIDTRIIVTCNQKLYEQVKVGKFREDLYYLLSSLCLSVPPLRERTADIEMLLEQFSKKYMNIYSRYHVITEEAKKIILNYSWKGNHIQLEGFCERMILTAKSRKIDFTYVQLLLERLYEDEGQHTTDQLRHIQYKDESKAVQITAILEKNNGNREKTAQELNISKTTLWRYMKKYGITNKYNI